MLIRTLFVIIMSGWVIYLTYTITAAATAAVPHIPEGLRMPTVAVLATGLILVALVLLLQHFGRRIADEVRYQMAGLRESVRQDAGLGPLPRRDGLDPDSIEAGRRLAGALFSIRDSQEHGGSSRS
ncbi:MAG: hypothetical protein ACRDT2_21760 [Natronosporangium sp.]